HQIKTKKKAKKKKEEYGKLEKAVMSIWEGIDLLNEFVDESDPDLDEPQIEHLLQSAEAIRRDYPDQDWLHITALIHGDTFPLGCAFDESIVHYQYFKENPDYANPLYRTRLGVYNENCGLENVTMSWGHDEYMYLVMKGNGATLPPAAFFIVRFHSFYSLHRAGAYTYLMNDEDKDMLKWLRVFNKYDLYSKSKVRINVDEVKPYYMSLINKYFPEKLRW
ncbi:putative Inositol oxygenase 5, partial [Cocos nucifera]